jgi:hypothetical protein
VNGGFFLFQMSRAILQIVVCLSLMDSNVLTPDLDIFTIRIRSGVFQRWAASIKTLAGEGEGSTDGTGAAASFMQPEGIAIDSAGNLYVADTFNSTIRKITLAGVVTTVVSATATSTPAAGNAATNGFSGVTIDSGGNLYVADPGNDAIRKITPAGVVTTIVGQPEHAGFTPGPLPGTLTSPRGVALFGTTLYTTSYDAIAQISDVP